MLNKIRTKPEIFSSKVDPSAARENKHFLLSFDFESLHPKSVGLQGVSCFGFFLVGVSTIEKKVQKPNPKE
jgi:hypothetical protein